MCACHWSLSTQNVERFLMEPSSAPDCYDLLKKPARGPLAPSGALSTCSHPGRLRQGRTPPGSYFSLKYTTLGASLRAAAMSGYPSPFKSPSANPYTAPFPSPKRTCLKLRPEPSLKKTDPGAFTYPMTTSALPSRFISPIAMAEGTSAFSPKGHPLLNPPWPSSH